jgi:hypothetical protein
VRNKCWTPFGLGGLAGLRNCEIIRAYPGDPVLKWPDVLWNKNLIYVRHEVAKKTRAQDRRRYSDLEPVAKEWLQRSFNLEAVGFASIWGRE